MIIYHFKSPIFVRIEYSFVPVIEYFCDDIADEQLGSIQFTEIDWVNLTCYL